MKTITDGIQKKKQGTKGERCDEISDIHRVKGSFSARWIVSINLLDEAGVEMNRVKNKTAGVNDASSSHFFIFHFFSLSSSLFPPHPSSLSLPRPAPSKSFKLKSVKGHFSSILTKALPTDGRTNQPTDGRTRPLIEMRGRI